MRPDRQLSGVGCQATFISRRPTSDARQQGFTLIEILIAVALLITMSGIAYQGVIELTNAGAHAQESVDRLAKLQKTHRLMEVDLEQLVPRSVRDAYGDLLPPVMTGIDGIPRIEFTRAGLRNPQGIKRSSLQRVAWALDDRTLVRYRWDVLDRAQDSEPRRIELLDGIEDVQIRFLDGNNVWQEQWPEDPLKQPPDTTLPRAVELKFTVDGLGELRWLFQGVS